MSVNPLGDSLLGGFVLFVLFHSHLGVMKESSTSTPEQAEGDKRGRGGARIMFALLLMLESPQDIAGLCFPLILKD